VAADRESPDAEPVELDSGVITPPVVTFVRVGTLDNPDALPPDIHIFTESKQPWIVLGPDVPAVPAYYDREKYWSRDSLVRRQAILPLIEEYQRSNRQSDA
jgi:hypothetical protein